MDIDLRIIKTFAQLFATRTSAQRYIDRLQGRDELEKAQASTDLESYAGAILADDNFGGLFKEISKEDLIAEFTKYLDRIETLVTKHQELQAVAGVSRTDVSKVNDVLVKLTEIRSLCDLPENTKIKAPEVPS